MGSGMTPTSIITSSVVSARTTFQAARTLEAQNEPTTKEHLSNVVYALKDARELLERAEQNAHRVPRETLGRMREINIELDKLQVRDLPEIVHILNIHVSTAYALEMKGDHESAIKAMKRWAEIEVLLKNPSVVKAVDLYLELVQLSNNCGLSGESTVATEVSGGKTSGAVIPFEDSEKHPFRKRHPSPIRRHGDDDE